MQRPSLRHGLRLCALVVRAVAGSRWQLLCSFQFSSWPMALAKSGDPVRLSLVGSVKALARRQAAGGLKW